MTKVNGSFLYSIFLLFLSTSAFAETTIVQDVSGTVPYIGSTNATALAFQVNGTEYMRLTATGSIGIGTTSPSAVHDINGAIKIGTVSRTCDSAHAGVLQWTGTNFQGCNGTSWVTFAN